MNATKLLYPPTSIGQLESLAGIEDRNKLWAPFKHLMDAGKTQACVNAAMNECRRKIRARIRNGEMSILFSPIHLQAKRMSV